MTKEENEARLERLKVIVSSLPEKPGCYQYFDENGTIIYVGKAKNLKRRVYSYFSKEHDNRKTAILVSKIRDIKYTVVLAYMPDQKTAEKYGDNTLYPDGLEFVPKRFAISRRNGWMIKKSAYVICYVHKITGGAYQFQNIALKKGCTVINIADIK